LGEPLPDPWALALHVPPAPAPASSSSGEGTAVVVVGDSGPDPDPDRDVGRLYVGCKRDVHAFDLTAGKRKCLVLPSASTFVSGLAVTRDGTRLFAVTPQTVFVIDTRTGASTPLRSASTGPVPVASAKDMETAAAFSLTNARGCVIDEATQSLVLCETQFHRIVRLRGPFSKR
jgi:DNA-binding beta-propeller fold protein YncE